MKMPLISIVVPIYNVQQYLDECIHSLVEQSYENIEIILVDDGSTDNSGIYADRWEIEDSRIKVIHKQNEGLGMARNTGIEMASGEYIMFVDSDDFLDRNAVNYCVQKILNDNVDTVYYSWMRFSDKCNYFQIPQKYKNEVFYKDEIFSKVALEMIGTLPNEKNDSEVYMSACHGIYSLKLIKDNGIIFESERKLISEDLFFNLDYLKTADCVCFIPEFLYFYRQNNNSLTTIYRQDRLEKEVIMYKELINRLDSNNHEIKCRIDRMFLGRVRSCIMRAVFQAEDVWEEIGSIVNNQVVQDVVSQYPYRKNPFRHKIFNYCLDKKCKIGLYILAKFALKV